MEIETKNCPCCRKIKPIEGGKNVISSSAGRESKSWRCKDCLAFRSVTQKKTARVAKLIAEQQVLDSNAKENLPK